MKNKKANKMDTKVANSSNQCCGKKEKSKDLVSWSEIISKVLGCCGRKISLIER